MSIADRVFNGCSVLTSVTLPEGVTAIGSGAFNRCSGLMNITIPENVTSIGSSAFFGCSGLTSVIIPEGVTSISDNTFEKCSGLTSIIIPEGVTSIGNYAFWGCSSLTSITIPENVTTIGKYAFYGCSGLTSITIPESVTSIGEYAFGFANLNTVTSFIKEPFEITDDVFMSSYDESWNKLFTSATLYVPAGTKEKYLATPAWNQFQNIVEMGLEPVEQGETIDYASDINADTNIDGNTVGDIYYSISSGDGSYDPSEGCIVVTSPTADETVSGLSGTDIFGEDFNDHFTGIVFKVAEGKGTIKIEAQTTGTMVLKVKIGDNDPIEMELESRLKVSFPYNVSEPTYVYIYGGTASAAPDMAGYAPATGELKLYGVEVIQGETGIESLSPTLSQGEGAWYTLDGQMLQGEPTRKGLYVHNGLKVVIK